MRTGLWLTATLTALVVMVSSCAGQSRPEVLWSFESAVLSSDGTEIEIEAFRVADSTCHEFDRVETKVDGEDLIVSLVYLGPESGQFCSISCPLGTDTLTVQLDDGRDVGLNTVKDRNTEPHCAETLRPNNG